mgnify:FL=1
MTTRTDDPNGLLMGAGGRSAKFETIGDSVTGFVESMATRQQTEIGSGTLRTWPDGNPRMQLVVTIETEQHEDDEDDGMRNLYVQIPAQMQKAIADAVRKAGEHGIAIGGKLQVRFVKTEAPKVRGFNPQKIYSAQYKEPDPSRVIMETPPEDTYIEPDDTPF